MPVATSADVRGRRDAADLSVEAAEPPLRPPRPGLTRRSEDATVANRPMTKGEASSELMKALDEAGPEELRALLGDARAGTGVPAGRRSTPASRSPHLAAGAGRIKGWLAPEARPAADPSPCDAPAADLELPAFLGPARPADVAALLETSVEPR